MRFFKFLSIAVITLLILLTITYSVRLSIINNLIKTQVSLTQMEITCLDVSLTKSMTIVVDKLCLQNVKADIEIVEAKIRWQYFPDIEITDIDVRRMKIKGKDHFFANINKTLKSNEGNKKEQDLSLLLSTTLQPYIEQASQFQLPINTNISEIFYFPFIDLNKPDKSIDIAFMQGEIPYKAALTMGDNIHTFSLLNADGDEYIKAKLIQEKESFSITLSSKLKLLKSLANTHQLPIPAELQNKLLTYDVSGNLDSLIEYQADFMSMNNQITDLSVNFGQENESSSAFKISGALNVNSQLNLASIDKANNNESGVSATEHNGSIELIFANENEILVEINKAKLRLMLNSFELSPEVASLIEDNPLTSLSLKSKNGGKLTLSNNKVEISYAELSARGEQRLHQIKLDNINLTVPNNIHPQKLTVENFKIDSQLKLADLAAFSSSPVRFHLEGKLQKEESTDITLFENSSITFNNIAIHKQKSNTEIDASQRSVALNSQPQLSIKTLVTTIEGSVQLFKDNELSLNIKTHNKAKQVYGANLLKINSFDVFSETKGTLDDISLKAMTSADGIKLGDIAITGPIKSPKVRIAANSLQLTDLLSLNISLPIEVDLIAGELSYSISGQRVDLSNIEKTDFNASIAITSLSGELDGTWLQDLNWHQDITLRDGKITTEPNIKENFTVELIETPTPISMLSMNTSWYFGKEFQFSANSVAGEVLGGSFAIPRLNWPIEQGHSVNVQLNSIDLEQVLALDKKQGIVVTGKISGELPITYDGEKYIIEEGELHNISNGLIQVMDNPAVAELKASNAQLQLAFDALQNLHYHQLSSAVSMADDGYMQLDTVIKGRNPDIDNDVNLNLNLSYDLLGLLESLSITQRFEESIINDLQKNKE